MDKEDIRICSACNSETNINTCWTDDGDYWCDDDCVPKWKWIEMFEEASNEV